MSVEQEFLDIQIFSALTIYIHDKIQIQLYISDIRIYSYKEIQFSVTEINIEIKTTSIAIIKR